MPNSHRMAKQDHGRVVGVLGPTNTGKTHLAIERLCAHSSGIMGFPLRLLAREVYDRVVAIKGAASVGLITGEEKILPPGARWLLCTAESMPVDREVAFVALDEAQLGADPERGHIFTHRLLSVRGREETMILGSEALRPALRALAPEAEIINRPRFSQLSYAGPRKLSRLPPRSAIVAFSAEHVYAVAEMLRRTRGGAAVVMGALSPSTRNAQVAMYQAGEVDYLVATDAIGMGLNMDVSHVAFAGLSKFDGKRQRRLTLAEMAQIAGRAGRHQRDGTFGTLAGGPEHAEFSEIEIDRIEGHRFPPLDHLLWRNAELDFSGIEPLIASLEELPDQPELRPAPLAVDLAVLRLLAGDWTVVDSAKGADRVRRLWDACGLPDFRKVGAEHHARLVAQIFGYLSSESGVIPVDWIARELTRLDNVQGDVETLSGRIASVRTWAYAANRADWTADPGEWQGRTRALELKLSDALHQRLTERFVDRRTTVLMRSIGSDPALLDVQVRDDGAVLVEDEAIGTLEGFAFRPDPTARSGERKRLLAAASLRLPRELARRAKRLGESPDHAFALITRPGDPLAIHWESGVIARLGPGRTLATPRITVEPAIAALDPSLRTAIEARISRWFNHQLEHRLTPLLRILDAASDIGLSPYLRSILAQLGEGGGHTARSAVDEALAAITREERHGLRRLGIVIGTLDLFHPKLLKPEPTRIRLALHAARKGQPMPSIPLAGLGLLDRPGAELAAAAEEAGFRRFGDQMLRIDLVERIARSAHDARHGGKLAQLDPALATSIGVGRGTLERIMRALGFRAAGSEVPTQWRWTGKGRSRPDTRPASPAFAALAALRRR